MELKPQLLISVYPGWMRAMAVMAIVSIGHLLTTRSLWERVCILLLRFILVNNLSPYLGDYQFDVYRMMKEFSKSKWDGFYPFTNVLVGTFSALVIFVAKVLFIVVAALSPVQTPSIQSPEASSNPTESQGFRDSCTPNKRNCIQRKGLL